MVVIFDIELLVYVPLQGSMTLIIHQRCVFDHFWKLRRMNAPSKGNLGHLRLGIPTSRSWRGESVTPDATDRRGIRCTWAYSHEGKRSPVTSSPGLCSSQSLGDEIMAWAKKGKNWVTLAIFGAWMTLQVENKKSSFELYPKGLVFLKAQRECLRGSLYATCAHQGFVYAGSLVQPSY